MTELKEIEIQLNIVHCNVWRLRLAHLFNTTAAMMAGCPSGSHQCLNESVRLFGVTECDVSVTPMFLRIQSIN